MKSYIKPLAAGVAILAAMGASAQNSYSGYFLDNYLNRYQMNPAFGNEKNFVSMPALGNLNVGVDGNLKLSSVLYNVDGRTVLFTNPNVSASEVMKNVHDKNRLGTHDRIDIINVGFKALGGYNTVSINARVNADLKVPGSLFSLAKEGIENRTYDLKELGVDANAYAEIALGHSRQINNKLRVGATLKFIIGAGNVNANVKRADLQLGENNWIATTNAEIYSSVKGLTYKHDYNDRTDHEYVNGVDIDSPGPNGFGMGLDLGAVYKLNDDWQFSAALLDFGFIKWNNAMLATTNGDQTVETDAFIFNPDDNATNSFSKEWDRLSDNLSNLYELSDMGDQGCRTRMLAATLNLAAEYTFPLYRKLKFGLLNTTRINGTYSTTNFRLSANVRPVKCFSADINYAVGTFGSSFGWMANVNVTGFNLFVSMDHTLGKLCKQGIPLSSRGSFNFGINFPF